MKFKKIERAIITINNVFDFELVKNWLIENEEVVSFYDGIAGRFMYLSSGAEVSFIPYQQKLNIIGPTFNIEKMADKIISYLESFDNNDNCSCCNSDCKSENK